MLTLRLRIISLKWWFSYSWKEQISVSEIARNLYENIRSRPLHGDIVMAKYHCHLLPICTASRYYRGWRYAKFTDSALMMRRAWPPDGAISFITEPRHRPHFQFRLDGIYSHRKLSCLFDYSASPRHKNKHAADITFRCLHWAWWYRRLMIFTIDFAPSSRHDIKVK